MSWGSFESKGDGEREGGGDLEKGLSFHKGAPRTPNLAMETEEKGGGGERERETYLALDIVLIVVWCCY